MRSKEFITSLALLIAVAAPSFAAGFGKVVAIGGQASDIVLDESRSQLYIANFGAATVQVMSTVDNTIHTSINVPPLPGSMALSLDSQYLVIAHYSNFTTSTSGNVVSVVNLANNTRQTFATGDAPLGVAFVRSGQSSTGAAMIVTTTGFVLLDPVSGQITSLNTFANLSQQLPVNQGVFPGQILQTALTTSRDGYVVWGVGGAGTGNQVIYTFNAHTGAMSIILDVSSPALLPRVSVSADGSSAMIGWAQFNMNGFLTSRYPNVISSANITGHAYDTTNGIIYGQFPDSSQPTGPAAGGVSTGTPAMLIMDADNLTVRDRITIPEDMVGRAVLDSAASTLYAISESGVMVLPVGSLSTYPRLTAGSEDVLVQTNFCNRSAVTQNLTITDPGGNHTDFTITPSQAGVIVSPSSGVTPATVHVSVDPTAFAGTNGTTPITLTLASASAVNQPRPVRVLMSNPDQDQRGTIVDVPGNLTDILPDPARNRFYIIRADKNQLQVYDGSSNQQIATFRTQTTPSMMAMTIDQNYLLVGHNDSQLVTVYDLNAMQQVASVVLPGGHYARSIAASNAAVLVLVRDESTGTGVIDSINVAGAYATKLATLGPFKNQVSSTGVLTASPNGATILLASPDGTVMLYSASANSFITSRQDFKSLTGAFAASNYGSYVVGGNILNSSLVPAGTLSTSSGTASGFAFIDQGGYLVTASSSSGPGVIQNMQGLQTASAVNPVRMAEAPLLPTATATGSSTGTGNSSGTGTGGNGSGSTSLYSLYAFTRTVAPMPGAGTVVVLTTSGFTVLAARYDAAVAPPAITSVVNAANGTQPVAPGGLISVFGSQMSPVNMATSQIPLPTALGDSCLSINGAPVPLLFVSGQQINAQLPNNVSGSSTLMIHSPAGLSNNFLFTVQSTAPSVFLSGTAGPDTGLATIVRADNNQLVTPTNPIHPKDTVVIYLTGMGATFPAVTAGLPAPSAPLAAAAATPTVTLGGIGLNVLYAGLVPGEVGVYQINATVPTGVPVGISVPLTISQGGPSNTLNVRVVN
jgi:uncharacterized protein (TIGR03437 family)